MGVRKAGSFGLAVLLSPPFLLVIRKRPFAVPFDSSAIKIKRKGSNQRGDKKKKKQLASKSIEIRN